MKNLFKTFMHNVQKGNAHYKNLSNKYSPNWLKKIEKNINPQIDFLAFINLINLIFFSYLRQFSFMFFLLSLFYYGWYHFMLSYYLLPHWKEFIVNNSPINFTATIVALLKLNKSQVFVACIACGSLAYGIDLAHERMWPEQKPPLQIIGEHITKYTGYPPKAWNKPK